MYSTEFVAIDKIQLFVPAHLSSVFRFCSVGQRFLSAMAVVSFIDVCCVIEDNQSDDRRFGV